MAAVLVCAFAYAAWLAPATSLVAGGSDSSGYLNYAESIRKGSLVTPTRTLPGPAFPAATDRSWMPLGFDMQPQRGWLVPTYPIGLPLLVAGATSLLPGDSGILALLVLLATLTPIATYVIARYSFGLDPLWAAVAGVCVAVSPQYLFSALQPMSDLAATVFATLTIGLALAGRSRRSDLCFALAGLAFGIGVLIRPSNAILAPALLTSTCSLRSLVFVGLGGLAPAAVFVASNLSLFGQPVATGYEGHTDLLGWNNVGPSLANIAAWGPAMTSWPVLGLAAVGLTLPPRLRRREHVVLGLWVLGFIGFYAFYFHTRETWWYLRFLLPALPAVALAGATTGARLSSGMRHRSQLASALVAVVVGLWCGFSGARWTTDLSVRALVPAQRTYTETTDWIAANVVSPAVIVSMQLSGSVYYYAAHGVLRWDLMSDEQLDRLRRKGGKRGARAYAALMRFEQAELEARGYGLDRALLYQNLEFGVFDWELVRRPGDPGSGAAGSVFP